MKRYKHTLSQSGKNQGAEIISLRDFIDALKYLEEREQTVVIDTSELSSCEGFLFLSFDMTARLFMQIASLVPSAVLKISVSGGELCIALCDNDGSSIPDSAALKIARTAFLAGFGIQQGGDIKLTAPLSLDRELAVYALSSVTLVERFKKYFKK